MINKQNLKTISIFCIPFILFIATDPLFADIETDHIILIDPELKLDQYQENDTYEISFHSHIELAQGFTPSMTPLTKIEIEINKPRKTTTGFTLSIRDSLEGRNLASKSIGAEDIPFFINWIEFDINDIDVTPGETYYIVLQSDTSSETPYRWRFDYSDTGDIYSKGKMYRLYTTGEWEKMETDTDYVDASFRSYTYYPEIDLVCEGYLNWSNVTPAQENLTGFFTVRNDGTPYSQLNWKIQTWPSWGTWTFSKLNGKNLRPEDGLTYVNINVEAPHINVPDEYLGKIIIINEQDENDSEIISARLITQKNKQKPMDFNSFITFFYHETNDIISKHIYKFPIMYTYFMKTFNQ
jgi:hypothetical protein